MQNNWLKERSEIMAKYAEAFPTKQDRIKITFDYPDAGWMPVHFFKNEEEMEVIEFSYVFDSFTPLREWLEVIADRSSSNAAITNIDCEYTHLALYYEPIWFYNDDDDYPENCHPAYCGIFSVYDEASKTFIFDAYCNTETFIRDTYKCIIDFAKAMKNKSEFIDDWVAELWGSECAEFEDDDPELANFFYNKVKSQKIEDYIRYMDSWHKNRNYWKRKNKK